MTYTTRVLSTDDLGACRALLAETQMVFSPEYLRWLYADNPRGNAVGFNAYAGNALVAHYATIPIIGRFGDRDAKGLLSLNTATHPSHQGKGLFSRLASETYAHAAQRGYEFVVGVANANSTPGFTKKLGFQLVTPLDVLVGAGTCTASTGDVGFSLSWSDDALRWRIARPGARYSFRGGELSGQVFAETGKAGILAYLGDAPRSLGTSLPPPGKARLRMWIGIDPQRTVRGLFRPLPQRLRPSPLNLIFRDLTGEARQLSREDTRFLLRDFDAY